MAGGVAPSGGGQVGSNDGKNYAFPLFVVTLLFFMWGAITCMNDILIPKFKEVFDLTNVQANLVQFAFFGAYFVISLVYFLFSKYAFDPIQKMGYKKAIIIGLAISAGGCFMFVPAASHESFGLFLTSLFVLATGVTILQMGANPYVTLLGSADGSESRLNMTQAFNALGTTVAPVVGGILIFGTIGLSSVKGPYIGLGVALLVLMALIFFSPLPTVVTSSASSDDEASTGKGALAYPHLVLGAICIFAYVGGEVSIGSNIIQYLKDVVGVAENKADALLAVYWGGAMIGRFYGAIFLSKDAIDKGKIVQIVSLAVLAFVLGVFLINKKHIIDSVVSEGEFSKKYEITIGDNPNTINVNGMILPSLVQIEQDGKKVEKFVQKLPLSHTEIENGKSFTSVSNQKIVETTKVTYSYEKKDDKIVSIKEATITYHKPVVFDANSLDINGAFIFVAMALLNVILFLIGKKKAGFTLGIFSLTVLVMLGVSILAGGGLAMWSVLCIGLFNSIMFPTIFSLAIKGLGKDTSQGASLLVMMIVGGGIMPLLHGFIADEVSVQLGFIVPAICYAYIAFYGFVGSKPKLKA